MKQEDDDRSEFDGNVVRLRGLPWSATAEDVVKFFGDAEILGGEGGVNFTYSREGRPSGEAFVEFISPDAVDAGLKKNNCHMGQRYIEVFRSKKSEMDWVIKRAGPNQSMGSNEAVVRLRGLPFGCSKEEIAQFFTGLEIVPNGIMLPEDRQGRSTGEAYVQFANQEIAERALGKHKERIGHRYIEIFKSSMVEANSAMGPSRIRPLMSGNVMPNRPGPYDRTERFGMGGGSGGAGGGGGFFEDDYDEYGGGYGGSSFGMGGGRMGNMRNQQQRGRMGGMGGGMNRNRGETPGSHYMSKTGHSVHMRGLPFQALEQDIFDFFAPLKPSKVEFEFGPNGRPTGEANVDFSTHSDAVDAMKKHKSNMQHRYIELFLNSTQSEDRMGGGYSSGMGGGGGFGSGMMGGNNMGGGSYSNDGSYGGSAGSGFGAGGSGAGAGGGGSSFNQGSNMNNSYGGGGGGYGDEGDYSGYGDSSMGGGDFDDYGGDMSGGGGAGRGGMRGGGRGRGGMMGSGGMMSGNMNNTGNMRNPNFTSF
ncbi:hypothetical protein ScPMuIL_003733 [Solemya velum]